MEALKSKRVIITGGASGIGKATVELYAEEGAAVAIVDINDADGKALAQEIRESGGEAIYIHGDVTRGGDCQKAVQTTIDQLGGLDILFNNAGTIRRADVVETSEDEWDEVMAVNVKSVFLMSKYAVPVMVERGGGVIINSGFELRATS